MPGNTTISSLLGGSGSAFRTSKWPEDLAVFRSDPDWFQTLSSMSVLRDPDEWLDRAPELVSFRTFDILARSEARRAYLAGESIYIIGLDRTVKPLRDLCDGIAADLAVNPRHVMVQAWAAGGATSVGMHFDLDYNFNLQITGRKQWQAAPNDLVAHPISSHHAGAGSGSIAADSGRELPTEMPADARTWQADPGDVVYVPRGVWHSTRTTEATFAIAFVIQPPTWADHLSTTLRDRLHGDARWRERVLGARDIGRHAELKTTALDVLSAAREILSTLGPSEMLYPSLWGQRPVFFKRRDDVVSSRLDAASGMLAWQRDGASAELAVPAWARRAVEYIVNTPGSWSIAVVHDLVDHQDVLFLNLLLKQMTEAGLLESTPAPSGGVAREAT